MAETIHERIERERKAANPRAQELREFRNYARGKQRSTLTLGQQRVLRGVTGKRHCDNVCKMVLTAPTQRLQLARYDVDNDGVLNWLSDFWTLTNLPTLANQVHWATLRDGDHALALSWDNDKGQVRLVREKWWDGKSGIFISYDELDQPLYAVKEWKDPVLQKLRRVVWWPDRIERYVAEGDGWRPYQPDANTPWSQPWVGADGKPLGLPVVHFRNIYMPNDSSDDDGDTSYGVSELDGGVLGLQDEINDIQRDITAAARSTGYQMLYATGAAVQKDENDKPIPLVVEPGAVFQSENPQARYGAIAAGDLGQLDKALSIKLRAVSRMTATPLHQITGGDWPSGEALLQADKPLVKKVVSMGDSIGPAWASVAHKATLLANTFAKAALDVEAKIKTIFKSPEWVDDLTQAEIGEAIAPFVSNEEVLRVLGRSPDAIKTIMGERDAEAKKKADAALSQAQAQAQIVQQTAPTGSTAPPKGVKASVPTPKPVNTGLNK